LGVAAGIATGAKGALQVNRHMETNLSDVYAAGGCAETWHTLLNRNTYLSEPLIGDPPFVGIVN
jgi:pyruvate/2-oxoglutarate dehydrogenase complex dihydrolipoamide dehydrogenase (E3) component